MPEITNEMISEAEAQIKELRKEVDYDTRDYAIDFLVQQFKDDEFYIPDEYQRQYIWQKSHKNKFIESILLGLPIPFMFFSDTDDGRCEIIDGAQRTCTLEEFMNGDLTLEGLTKLTKLNGFSYDNLPDYYKRKFKKTTMRIIVLSDDTTVDIRKEIFNRINTTGVKANASEVRRGSYAGPFMDFLKSCTNNPLFIKNCPVSAMSKKRYEDLELVIRFFAFLNNIDGFSHRVDDFLDDYVKSVPNDFDRKKYHNEFLGMLTFVDKYFPNGFKKKTTSKSTPRVRFEAISVGVALALRENPDLVPASMAWLDSSEFKFHTTTHASNSVTRVKGRVKYVKDMLLNGDSDADGN